jgi:CheY-like chemotaxis protein
MLNIAQRMPAMEEFETTGSVVQLADYRSLIDNWNILLVEDDPSDAMLTEIALNGAAIRHTTHTAANGNEALECLKGGIERNLMPPDIVFLDLSLPDKDGFEILAEIAAMPLRYRSLPFVILTGSDHYQYITHTYDLWMPAYLTKPCTSEKLQEAFEAVRRHAHQPTARQ